MWCDNHRKSTTIVKMQLRWLNIMAASGSEQSRAVDFQLGQFKYVKKIFRRSRPAKLDSRPNSNKDCISTSPTSLPLRLRINLKFE